MRALVEQRRGPAAVVLAGTPLALFRDDRGRPAALLDQCPHRFAPLSAGRVTDDGRLACRYHGWRFDAAGIGESPSRARTRPCAVRAFQAIERHGFIWVASVEAPAHAMPDVAPAGYTPAGTISARIDAPLHVVLDNFSENEHTPFVHTLFGWGESSLDSIEFDAENFDDRTEVHYRAPQRYSPLLRLLGLEPGDVYHNDWVTRFDPPRSEYSIYWRSADGTLRPVQSRSTIFFFPETERTTWWHAFVFLRLEGHHRRFRPLIERLTLWLANRELQDDIELTQLVAQSTPLDVSMMQLGKFDKPLVHNRRLLRTIYRGEAMQPRSVTLRTAGGG